ncbi:MAG: hypothetical protein IJ773_12345 [Lachnospiraceae bacterium]|nr:hypothetical protein [Lachnospiraceae bacterium]
MKILRNASYHFLLTQFQCGLFDNPYIELENALAAVWNSDTDKAAKESQLKTVIMLKNSDNVIKKADETKKTVYIPYIFTPASVSSSSSTAASWKPALDLEAAGKYFTVVTDTVGRDKNYSQLELLEYVNTIKGDAKVVVLMSKASGPSVMVFSEVEPLADAILFYYGSTSWFFADALLEIVNGDVEPSALLPFQMPASMDAVEAQLEDVPRDMECYVDADGNVYDFAYGLNWNGKIEDERVKTYSVEPLAHVESIEFHYAD